MRSKATSHPHVLGPFLTSMRKMAWLPLAVLLLRGSGALASDASRPVVSLNVGQLVSLVEHFDQYRDELPAPERIGATAIVAYEEHSMFAYVCGTAPIEALGTLQRRVVLLKTAVVLVDDILTLDRPSSKTVSWELVGDTRQVMRPGANRIKIGDRTLELRTLECGLSEKSESQSEANVWRCQSLFQLAKGGADLSEIESIRGDRDQNAWTIAVGKRRFRLTLPRDNQPGTIAITSGDGKLAVPRRLLPSGVMPHGEKGVKMLESWDSSYEGNRRPGWDVGRAASDLKKAIEGRVIRPGRAVVLGCGSGTNAIYLARQGFDVTAMDLAPRALARAKAKADEADVHVRWLLADVTAPPDVDPFDLVFDRGCYHGVRRSNATGYVAALCRLTRPGSHVLILAGNANEERHYGPPRVKEEELRADFGKTFEFVSLQETNFDTADSDRKGALAWAILLKRN